MPGLNNRAAQKVATYHDEQRGKHSYHHSMRPSIEHRECFHQQGKQQSTAEDKAPKRCALLFWCSSYQWTSRATRIPQKGEEPGQFNHYGYPFQTIEFVQGRGGGTNDMQDQRNQCCTRGERG